jgi:hypothetical protein
VVDTCCCRSYMILSDLEQIFRMDSAPDPVSDPT